MKNKYKTVKGDIKEIIDKPYYNSIINLLRAFQHKENGLEKKHFKYALMKNNGLIYKTSVERFFQHGEFYHKENYLDQYFKNKFIIKGIIKTEELLDYYIGFLEEKNIIKRTRRNQPFRYILTYDFIIKRKVLVLEENLKNWEFGLYHNRDSFYRKYMKSDVINHNGLVGEINKDIEDWDLFGLPLVLEDEVFNNEEINRIAGYLRIIEQYLWKITELKKEKLKNLIVDINQNNIDEYHKIYQKMRFITFVYRSSF